MQDCSPVQFFRSSHAPLFAFAIEILAILSQPLSRNFYPFPAIGQRAIRQSPTRGPALRSRSRNCQVSCAEFRLVRSETDRSGRSTRLDRGSLSRAIIQPNGSDLHQIRVRIADRLSRMQLTGVLCRDGDFAVMQDGEGRGWTPCGPTPTFCDDLSL